VIAASSAFEIVELDDPSVWPRGLTGRAEIAARGPTTPVFDLAEGFRDGAMLSNSERTRIFGPLGDCYRRPRFFRNGEAIGSCGRGAVEIAQ